MVSDRPYGAVVSEELALDQLEVGAARSSTPSSSPPSAERRAHRRYDLASARAA